MTAPTASIKVWIGRDASSWSMFQDEPVVVHGYLYDDDGMTSAGWVLDEDEGRALAGRPLAVGESVPVTLEVRR